MLFSKLLQRGQVSVSATDDEPTIEIEEKETERMALSSDND